MKPKTDAELVDEFCKINNLYDGLEDEEAKMLMRIVVVDTIDCVRYMLRQRIRELTRIIFVPILPKVERILGKIEDVLERF